VQIRDPMIKFFRKIRKKLIEQENVRKYTLYAIGEILLVVIGILIALQLNILKEEAGERKVTEKLLSGVQADLKLEADRIDFLYAYYSTMTEGIQNILLFQQEKENYTNKELGRYFLETFEFRNFSKIDINYQTLYGSGLLQNIEDTKLTEEIITYYSTQFLEWSLEVYQYKIGRFDFNNAAQFHPLDKLQTPAEYVSIPDFRLDTSAGFKTDFKVFLKEPDVLNHLVDLLHQSELVFYNLKTYRESNQTLSNRIQNYQNK